MKSVSLALASALAGALAITSAALADDMPKMEKCYGIAKAGKNDCQTVSSSCAGTARSDGKHDAWLYLPAGTCEKVVGGSLEPKKM